MKRIQQKANSNNTFMKVAIIFLDYHRHEYTEKTMAHNLHNAGHDFVFIYIDQVGIAAAINAGIKKAKDYNVDAVVTMANDILMPFDWLRQMVNHAEGIKHTGMCGIHTVEGEGETVIINGLTVKQSFTAFGNVLIPMEVIDEVGGFNTKYDPYGMQDADFAYRTNAARRINYYIPGLKAEHIGHDAGSPTEYRKMKDEGLGKALAIWEEMKLIYDAPEYTINMQEYFEI
jgi:GT2 family glycosyltransferase